MSIKNGKKKNGHLIAITVPTPGSTDGSKAVEPPPWEGRITPEVSAMLEQGRVRAQYQSHMRSYLDNAIANLESIYPEYREDLVAMLDGHAQRIRKERELHKIKVRDAERNNDGT